MEQSGRNRTLALCSLFRQLEVHVAPAFRGIAPGDMGVGVQLAMVAAGVGSIVTESEPVFTAIKVAGAAYLIVLGVRVVRDRRGRQSGLRKEGEPVCQARC